MQKPNTDIASRDYYPKALRDNFEEVTKNLNERITEDIKDLFDDVYKVAYVDGFRDALFYMDIE